MMVMPCGLPVEQQGGGRRRRDSELHTTYQNLQRTEEPPAAASARAVAADRYWWCMRINHYRNLDLRGTIAEAPELVVHEVLTDVSAATYICAKPIFSLKLAAVRARRKDIRRDICGNRRSKPQKLRRQGVL
ncbi:unnamed protein product [Sphagnum jensenii]|uniref:Uncharacterized protein n=1 Tax=Sphagnum jensenii TaxID=128206 RepID=A0ABP1AA92_9BRYO